MEKDIYLCKNCLFLKNINYTQSAQSQTSPKGVAILGSTGSIGIQALEILKRNPDSFNLIALTAHQNAKLLIEQALLFRPRCVVIVQTDLYDMVKNALSSTDIKVFCGADELPQVVQMDEIDVVLNALVGAVGLLPTMSAIKAGKNIALANKETLVVAGDLVMRLSKKHKVRIYPVDSEHSAIYQCLKGENTTQVDKIYLTASGGPFLGKKIADLQEVTLAQALKHPNWRMGSKISIDSATLMNKGLEVIEARWLFDVSGEKIKVLIHPQSIIHSMVEFFDGAIKAQLGVPDMKLPIQYGLNLAERLPLENNRLDFAILKKLTFEEPDTETFPNLNLAYLALEKGGNWACALNAANEEAVNLFLKGEINFLDIARINAETLSKVDYLPTPDLYDYMATDKWSRKFVLEMKKAKIY
jgi:1-deoxy-D-xylulose-5-phosphate reductoisomerase